MKYRKLAPFYDHIMNHVKYYEWANLIEAIIKKYCNKQKISILELGGGTGTLGKQLKNKNCSYIGSDKSFDMSKEAIKKNLSFFCADARSLPTKKQFDLIIFLYDGINYLLSLKDFKKVFYSVASCLKKSGLFLFDITTEANSYRYFYDFIDYQECNDTSLIRHSFYNQNKSLQINDFTLFCPHNIKNNLYEKFTEHHVQKIFSPVQIKKVIPENIFSCIGIWDGYSMFRYSNNSERIHFLLQKM